MYRIICPGTSEYEHMDPLMTDYMDIMSNYNKGILVMELSTGLVFINDVAVRCLSTGGRMVEESILLLVERLNLESMNAVGIRQEILLDDLRLKAVVTIKCIREKDVPKYMICMVDELVRVEEPTTETAAEQVVLGDIIGESPAISELKDTVRKAAKSDSTILLMGDTGTGKEMFAKAIHRLSSRSNRPFVAINCGAIPDTLIESEIFGYEKGAFTGANVKGKPGKFEQAHGGTVFLDEIENMSVFLQMKLLRVLEDRKVTRVGGLEEIPVDIRILAATNCNLKEMVGNGEFRRDLYYRLNIIKVNIPNLRNRGQDVLMLSKHFIRIFSIKMRKPIEDLSDEVKEMFLNHPWEGNVRELRNTIEYAMNFEEGVEISKRNLPEQFFIKEKGGEIVPKFRTIAELERAEIERALDYFGWDDKGKQKVAKVLDISRSSIYRKVSR